MGKKYFSEESLKFLRRLEKNNNREWFNLHKTEYEDRVREPALEFISDMGESIDSFSKHFLAIPKKVGGSLMRPYRDIRFGKDKRPFKTNVGIHFRHYRAKDVHAPGFYVHIEPGKNFVGAGIWRPDGPSLASIRKAIDGSPDDWLKVSRAKPFSSRFEPGGDVLANPPRGYKKDHPLIEDLKRKDFIAISPLGDKTVIGSNMQSDVSNAFKISAPYVRFLCKALDLPF